MCQLELDETGLDEFLRGESTADPAPHLAELVAGMTSRCEELLLLAGTDKSEVSAVGDFAVSLFLAALMKLVKFFPQLETIVPTLRRIFAFLEGTVVAKAKESGVEIDAVLREQLAKMKLVIMNETQQYMSDEYLELYQRYCSSHACAEGECFRLILDFRRLVATQQLNVELNQQIIGQKLQVLANTYGVLPQEQMVPLMKEILSVRGAPALNLGLRLLELNLEQIKLKYAPEPHLSDEFEDNLFLFTQLFDRFTELGAEVTASGTARNSFLVLFKCIVSQMLQFNKFTFTHANNAVVLTFQNRLAQFVLMILDAGPHYLTQSLDLLDSVILLNSRQAGAYKEVIRDYYGIALLVAFKLQDPGKIQQTWSQYERLSENKLTRFGQILQLRMMVELQDEPAAKSCLSALLRSLLEVRSEENTRALVQLIQVICQSRSKKALYALFAEYVGANKELFVQFFTQSELAPECAITICGPFASYLRELLAAQRIQDQGLDELALAEVQHTLLHLSVFLVDMLEVFFKLYGVDQEQRLLLRQGRESGRGNGNGNSSASGSGSGNDSGNGSGSGSGLSAPIKLCMLCSRAEAELLYRVFWN